MPLVVRMLIVYTSVALFCLTGLAAVFGGGFVQGVFPVFEGPELELVPLEPKATPGTSSMAATLPRLEIPERFRTSDQPPPMELPDERPAAARPDVGARDVRGGGR